MNGISVAPTANEMVTVLQQMFQIMMNGQHAVLDINEWKMFYCKCYWMDSMLLHMGMYTKCAVIYADKHCSKRNSQW